MTDYYDSNVDIFVSINKRSGRGDRKNKRLTVRSTITRLDVVNFETLREKYMILEYKTFNILARDIIVRCFPNMEGLFPIHGLTHEYDNPSEHTSKLTGGKNSRRRRERNIL